ncbi:hypothetical protein FSP39_024165 [Pinctada imbricata]|uniref:C2H2-type domain-containing protein n=1 Tax=Pinctada imbricata TaxID=66713 RepID=A0AA89BQ94_PINIB|nr:hypothetical protein FSP39_024165 [Pinctada imbricata]
MKELKREISYLTSTTNLSLLRRSESRCLATFSFDKVNEEVKLFAPLFHKMVSTITKESCIGTAVTSCIALKSANTHMSAFQHVIGQVLDHGGATDEFYKVTSAGEPGTLSHLRNTVGRVDVHGPDEVIQKYRSHYAFVEDCLDAFIVGAYMHLSGTQNLQTESPLQQTMFNFLSDEQKYTFIHKLSKDILDKYVKTDIHNIRRKTDALDTQSSQLKDMYCSEKMKYVCPNCNKLYNTKGGMKGHLNKQHGFSFELGDENSTTEKDHIATYRASFMTCALLLLDTNDAYEMGDGNRITVNAKFQMLLARVGKHTKYQLWLFRYLA